ncbi:hypothetical protein [Brachybacterium hainanense]|uniref:Uncharacterized protein n=1 Tax=Brachybacterium hainanense TaxID=1541174 RepID=A0ABV6R8V9_9MICO
MPSTDDDRAPDGSVPAETAAEVRRGNQNRIQRALLAAVGVGILIDLVIIAIAALALGRPELHGALIGSGLALVVTVPTLVTARITRDREVMVSAALLVGAWLVKMFVLIIVLALLQDATSISRPWIGIALLAGAVAAAVAEALLLLRGRARLEVEPPSVRS